MTDEIKALKRQLRELRAEMRLRGIKETSWFNDGMDRETQRYNEHRFAIEAAIDSATTRL